MTTYIALLRAVNVGGTGKLPMSELRAMCCDAGFTRVETYIASGNVVFQSEATPSKIQAELEARLQAFSGKPARVIVRSEREMLAVLKANPFPKAAPNSTYVVFLSEPPPSDALAHASGQKDEQISLGEKEIYIQYGSGMGRSKLQIPAAKTGTARNMNTVAKLVEMATKL